MKTSWSALIIKDKKILLIKRAKTLKSYPWYWWIPWWWQEWNETPEEIVIREVKEEVGLDFIPTKLYDRSVTLNCWNEYDSYRFIWDYEWEISLQAEEAEEYSWFDYNSAIELNLAYDNRRFIELLYNDWIL